MAADVVDGIDGAVLVADDEDRIGVDVEREIIAGVWDFAGVTGEEPAFAPDCFQVVAVNFRIRIEGPEQTVVGGLAIDEILNNRWGSGQTIDSGTDHARWLCMAGGAKSRARRRDEKKVGFFHLQRQVVAVEWSVS